MPIVMSLNMRPGCQTLLNAFSTSGRMVAIFFLRFLAFMMESRTLTSWRMVLWFCLNPYCSRQILCEEYNFSLIKISLLYNSLKVFKREIGWWLVRVGGPFLVWGAWWWLFFSSNRGNILDVRNRWIFNTCGYNHGFPAQFERLVGNTLRAWSTFIG